jgi:hypothetical protein
VGSPSPAQERALAITGGRVWVPFGAQAGDCSNYKGRVVGVRLDGTGDPVVYDPRPRPTTGQTRGQVSAGQANRFATPAIYGNLVLVPTFTGVVFVRTS